MQRWPRPAARSAAFLRNARGDGDALTLTAGKLQPAAADDRGKAIRQAIDEVAASGFGRCTHLSFSRVRPAIADIFHDRSLQQTDVLRNNRDGCAKAFLCDTRNVLTADQDAARIHVVESLHNENRVDLPLPDAPTRPTRSPGSTRKLNPSNTLRPPG